MSTAFVERRLSVAEVSETMGVSVHTVLRWIDDGELRAANVGRRGGKRPTWKIHPDDLRAFELRRSNVLGRNDERKPRLRVAGYKRYV